MFGYIYRTVNLINDLIYIGQHHGNFDPNYSGSGLLLMRAVKKYGRNKFATELIESADNQEELDKLEKKYISVHKSCGVELYNLHVGGSGHQPGDPVSKETREKISRAVLGRVVKQSTREKLRAAFIGIPRPPGLMEKMRAAKIGKPVKQSTKDKMSAARKGRVIKQETRDKIRNTLLGSKHSQERIENLKLAWVRRKQRAIKN